LSVCSDVEPHGGVGEDTGESDALPEELVGGVALGRGSPLGKLFF